MSTETVKEMWAVVCDDDELEIIPLDTLVKVCRKAFTEPKPRALQIPVLSIWDTKEEAQKDLECLRSKRSV
jgi:hypothetical protein